MSFIFYDLETSGISPRVQRIMQAAMIRTNDQLQILDKKTWLVEIDPEVLPDPEAIFVTGIIPQQARQEGQDEHSFITEFIDELQKEPGTCIMGYNTLRFDDEFLRYSAWRNFHDPYAWHSQNGNSRWDLLDVVRMTRALRPGNIKWPVNEKGVPTNRLELLTKENGISHQNAHDALADVEATIELAKLLKTSQPKLFNYLYENRMKSSVLELLRKREPLVYSSGRFASENEKTTIVVPIDVPGQNYRIFSFNLRFDPSRLLEASEDELISAAKGYRMCENDKEPIIKIINPSRCPALAPLGVMDEAAWDRINLSFDQLKSNLAKFMQVYDLLSEKLEEALGKVSYKKDDQQEVLDPQAQLYDGFVQGQDRSKISGINHGSQTALELVDLNFDDQRLEFLKVAFLAHHAPQEMTPQQRNQWGRYRQARQEGKVAKAASLKDWMQKIQDVYSSSTGRGPDSSIIIEQLVLWAESNAFEPEAEN